MWNLIFFVYVHIHIVAAINIKLTMGTHVCSPLFFKNMATPDILNLIQILNEKERQIFYRNYSKYGTRIVTIERY